MPVCPKCNAIYTQALRFCSTDGMPLLYCSDAVYLPLGTNTGGLTVRERLRTDALGVVYRATAQSSGNDYCIRLFHPELINPELYERIETVGALLCEGLAIAEVPATYHIITLNDGRKGIVSEYIPGITLESFIQNSSRMAPKSAVAMLLCIAEIIDKAHRAGFTHGSLAPDNILLIQEHIAPRQDTSRIKLLDFGIGRTVASYNFAALKKCATELLGKDASVYYAPELLAGSREQTGEKSDVYSLGALCYYLISGQPPFVEKDSRSAVAYITDSQRRLLAVDPSFGVPASLEKLMLEALSFDPKRRPTLSELLLQLREIELEIAVPRQVAKASANQLAVAQVADRVHSQEAPEAFVERMPPTTKPKTLQNIQQRTSKQESVSVPQQTSVITKQVKVPIKYWIMFVFAAIGFLTITAILSLAIFRPRVGTIIVTTIPAGAQIELDGKVIGLAPAELEQVPAGVHKLKLSKQGYLPVERDVTVTASKTVTLPLISLQPEKVIPEASSSNGSSPEERAEEFFNLAQEAFARGDYISPENNNAFYYCNAVLSINPLDQRVPQMMQNIKDALFKQAETAYQKGDLATAQQVYSSITEKFPEDNKAAEALRKLEAELSSRRGELAALQSAAEEALRTGRLTEPPQASAYYYSAQILAIERNNPVGLRLRQRVKEELIRQAEASVQDDPKIGIQKFEELLRLFPEDKRAALRLKTLREQLAQQQQAASLADPRKRRELGIQKYAAGDYLGATTELETAVKAGIRDSDTLFYLASANWKRGQLASAISYFHQVLDINPNHVPSLVALAQIAENRNDNSMALSYYEKALRAGGNSEYPRSFIEKRIEAIKSEFAAKDKRIEPFSANVIHDHAFGSCSGTLTVTQQGVTFTTDSDHGFRVPLNGISEIQVSSSDKVGMKVLGKKYNFKFPAKNGDRFSQTYTEFRSLAR